MCSCGKGVKGKVSYVTKQKLSRTRAQEVKLEAKQDIEQGGVLKKEIHTIKRIDLCLANLGSWD